MARDSCDFCCQPGQLALGVESYRTTQLRILCAILEGIDTLDPEGGGVRYDWELLCAPEGGRPILWRAEYTTAGVITLPPLAFELDGSAYSGEIDELVACNAIPDPLEISILNPEMDLYRNLDTDPTGDVVSATPVSLYSAEVFNNDPDVPAYVKLYDQAGAPDETDTPVKTWMIPAASGLVISFDTPITFTVGLGLRATTGIADADTGDPGSNVVITNLGFI